MKIPSWIMDYGLWIVLVRNGQVKALGKHIDQLNNKNKMGYDVEYDQAPMAQIQDQINRSQNLKEEIRPYLNEGITQKEMVKFDIDNFSK